MPEASKQIVTLEDKAQQLDNAADKFSSAFENSKTPFSSALALSNGIKELRGLLDDGIMSEIMNLADTPLGFLTDRGMKPERERYQVHEVRDAIIEASLRGFRVAGNEFNIISSRFYAAKNGLHRKVVTYPGVTDFKEFLGVPKLSGDRGAIVTAKATWLKDNIKCDLSREFAIRVNAGMGSDAILGKCQRKLYAAVLNRLSGIITPEGEVDDAVIRAEPVALKAIFNGGSEKEKEPAKEDFLSGTADPKQEDNQSGGTIAWPSWQGVKDRFKKLNVTVDELLNFLELEHESEVTKEDCQNLYEVYVAIEGKTTTIEERFPRPTGSKPVFSGPVQTRAQEDFLAGVGDPKEVGNNKIKK